MVNYLGTYIICTEDLFKTGTLAFSIGKIICLYFQNLISLGKFYNWFFLFSLGITRNYLKSLLTLSLGTITDIIIVEQQHYIFIATFAIN